MRVIQRDSISFNCSKNVSHINIDTKTDFRYFTNREDIKNSHFEILINSSNYPLKIYGDFSKFGGMFQKWSYIRSLDNSCKDIDMNGLPPLFNDTLFKITDTSISKMILVFDYHVGINENTAGTRFNFNISPNPFTDQIKIVSKNLLSNTTLQVKIYNLLGQLEKIEKLNSSSENIDLTHLKQGIYFIEIDDNANNIFRQKIIKY